MTPDEARDGAPIGPVPALDDATLDRVRSLLRYVHADACPRTPPDVERCVACPNSVSAYHALVWLDEHPRDAAGARLILHRWTCTSYSDGVCSDPADHARRFARTVAAIRRFRNL